MSDLLRALSRQLSRPQPGAAGIRPRGRSRFEPYGEGPVSFGADVTFAEAESPAPIAPFTAREPRAPMQPFSERTPHAETSITPQPERRETAATPAPARETIREIIRSAERMPQPGSHPAEAHAAPMAPPLAARAERPIVPAVTSLPVTAKTTVADRQEPLQPQAIRPQAATQESRRERSMPRSAERNATPALAPRSQPRVPAEDMGRSRAVTAQPATQAAIPPVSRQEITIEIGSIVVRGDAPERRASHNIAAAPPSQPTLSLERYLQHRGGAN